MLTVKLDASPINEILFGARRIQSTPCGRHPQRVGIEHHPVTSAGDASGTWVQPYRDSLVRDVVSGTGDFICMSQTRAIIHRVPWLNQTRFRTPRISFGKSRDVCRIDIHELRWIVRLQVGLADVVNHVIFLRRHHPRLSSHQAKTARQRLVHCKRVASVTKFPCGESQRRGQ